MKAKKTPAGGGREPLRRARCRPRGQEGRTGGHRGRDGSAGGGIRRTGRACQGEDRRASAGGLRPHPGRNVRNGLAVVTVKRDACGGCSTASRPSVRWTSARARRSLSANTAAASSLPIPTKRRNRDDTNSEKASGKPGAFFVFKYFCKCGNVNLLTSKIFPTFANNP